MYILATCISIYQQILYVNNFSFQFARLFYIAQWYRDTTVEAQKAGHEDEFDATEAEKTTEVLQNVERRKHFLLSQVESTHRLHTSYR